MPTGYHRYAAHRVRRINILHRSEFQFSRVNCPAACCERRNAARQRRIGQRRIDRPRDEGKCNFADPKHRHAQRYLHTRTQKDAHTRKTRENAQRCPRYTSGARPGRVNSGTPTCGQTNGLIKSPTPWKGRARRGEGRANSNRRNTRRTKVRRTV